MIDPDNPGTDSGEVLGEEEPQPSDHELGIEELQALLFGQKKQKFEDLFERFTTPEALVREISNVLPDAVVVRTKEDGKLAKALMPTIEEAIKISVRRNPHPLVEAMFPVIGPSIRKSIAETVRGMIQTFNEALEHSLSFNGLKWRLESWRTGKPFGEIVLLHSLIYRVEQLFVIHRESGLLLQHIVSSSAIAQDADMVSGMLTAIQDFVRDSFQVQKTDSLETLNIGDLTVWIEQGPHAVLAAVVRGTPPQDLRTSFQDALHQIHVEHAPNLADFTGDVTPFESSKAILEDCLQARYQAPKRKFSPFFYVTLALILGVVGLLAFWLIRDNNRWRGFVHRLESEPGIVVTSVDRRFGKNVIVGLRDPLALDPLNFIGDFALKPEDLEIRWEPYFAFYPQFVLTRAQHLLQPPATAKLSFLNGVVTGEGAAPMAWIRETQRLAPFIPGVNSFEAANLIAAETLDRDRLVQEFEEQIIKFKLGTDLILPGQEAVLDRIKAIMIALDDLLKLLDHRASITIVGHTDSSGSESTNQQLSQKRADVVIPLLWMNHLRNVGFVTLAVANTKPLREELTPEDSEYNRSVSFEVTITDEM